jgi:hypothetical protein
MLRDPGKRASRYHVFILSLWEEGGDYPDDHTQWRYSLENAHRVERKGFKNLEELIVYLEAWTQVAPEETASPATTPQ